MSIGGTFALFDFRPSMTMSGNELCRRACGATQSCHTALLGTCVCVYVLLQFILLHEAMWGAGSYWQLGDGRQINQRLRDFIVC